MEQTSKISRARLVVVTTMELQDLLLKLKGIDCLCERGLLNNPIKKCVQTKRQSWFLVRNTIITCVGLYIAIAGFNQNILSTRNTYTNRDAAIAVQHSFLRKADQEYLNHRRHKEECKPQFNNIYLLTFPFHLCLNFAVTQARSIWLDRPSLTSMVSECTQQALILPDRIFCPPLMVPQFPLSITSFIGITERTHKKI